MTAHSRKVFKSWKVIDASKPVNVAGVFLALIFCTFFAVSYFTNKYVLSILKFTFPTIFQGPPLGLYCCWLLGNWVGLKSMCCPDLQHFPSSLGLFLFIRNIYAGSKALSLLVTCPVP
ncbi:transmembrane protein 241 [Myxocyprinus asiaticus]|uniref:transmembrane protein 241 n=1 Tax=Myxocyprinus asiaticus TaxID=70543 RepID=UPI002222391C|nr:transmembrane protein 241 [Myxocyprinus asiaticus]